MSQVAVGVQAAFVSIVMPTFYAVRSSSYYVHVRMTSYLDKFHVYR